MDITPIQDFIYTHNIDIPFLIYEIGTKLFAILLICYYYKKSAILHNKLVDSSIQNRKQLETLEQLQNQPAQKPQNEYEATIFEKNQAILQLKNQIKEQDLKIKELEIENNKINQELQAKIVKIEQEKEHINKQLELSQKELETSETQKKSQAKQQETEVQNLKKFYENEIQNLKNTYKNKVTKVKEEHFEIISKLKSKEIQFEQSLTGLNKEIKQLHIHYTNKQKYELNNYEKKFLNLSQQKQENEFEIQQLRFKNEELHQHLKDVTKARTPKFKPKDHNSSIDQFQESEQLKGCLHEKDSLIQNLQGEKEELKEETQRLINIIENLQSENTQLMNLDHSDLYKQVQSLKKDLEEKNKDLSFYAQQYNYSPEPRTTEFSTSDTYNNSSSKKNISPKTPLSHKESRYLQQIKHNEINEEEMAQIIEKTRHERDDLQKMLSQLQIQQDQLIIEKNQQEEHIQKLEDGIEELQDIQQKQDEYIESMHEQLLFKDKQIENQIEKLGAYESEHRIRAYERNLDSLPDEYEDLLDQNTSAHVLDTWNSGTETPRAIFDKFTKQDYQQLKVELNNSARKQSQQSHFEGDNLILISNEQDKMAASSSSLQNNKLFVSNI